MAYYEGEPSFTPRRKKILPAIDPLEEEEMRAQQAPVANAGSVTSTAAMGSGWGAWRQPVSSEVHLDREMTVAPPTNPIAANYGQKEMGGGGGPASSVPYKQTHVEPFIQDNVSNLLERPFGGGGGAATVSYTHLTLPTIYTV